MKHLLCLPKELREKLETTEAVQTIGNFPARIER